MLIDLKAHYLDLIVGAVEAGGNACLHRPVGEEKGALYVTRSKEDTKSEYVILYGFGPSAFTLEVQFRDQRPSLVYSKSYHDGLEEFWPAFAKALTANRLPNKTHEPERGPEGEYSLVGARK